MSRATRSLSTSMSCPMDQTSAVRGLHLTRGSGDPRLPWIDAMLAGPSLVERLSASLAPAPETLPEGGGAPAGVLVPVIAGAAPSLVFTKRTEDLRRHPGEISFPGGLPHPEDADLRATALRETEEEIGVPAGSVEVVGTLPPISTFVTGILIVPFVGLLRSR